MKSNKTPSENWIREFHKAAESTTNSLNTILSQIGLHVVEVPHNFSNGDSEKYGIFLRHGKTFHENTIEISLNPTLVFEKLSELGKTSLRDARHQASILTAHETAHGIIDHIRKHYTDSGLTYTSIVSEIKKNSQEEERTARDFSLNFVDHSYKSLLRLSLTEILEITVRGET